MCPPDKSGNMAEYLKEFEIEIVTPDRKLLSDHAVLAVVPAADGEMGILANHAPLAAANGVGQLVIEKKGGQRRQFFLAGGFTQFRANSMAILAEQCIPVDELKEEDIRKEITEAEKLPQDDKQAASRRSAAIKLANAKLAVLHKLA